MQRVNDDIDRFLLDVSHGRLHQAGLALVQLGKPMPRSSSKICSVITSAAHHWLYDIGNAKSLVSVAHCLGSGIDGCGKEMTTVALKATYSFPDWYAHVAEDPTKWYPQARLDDQEAVETPVDV
eukprot:4792109-Karenia_brevis.AAC.1